MSIGKKAVMVKYTKRKLANGDMLQYFADHPEKLREKRLRDAKKKHAMVAFSEELEKIAEGFLTNIGTGIANTAKSMGQGLLHGPANTAGVVGDIARAPGAALRAGWNQTWTGGRGAKALMLAGTAAQVPSIFKEKDITGRDESKLTRALRFGGGFLGSTAGYARGHIVPSMVLGMAGDVAGGYAGRAIDRARGRKAKPKTDLHEAVPTKPAIAQQALQG
jgi:hypothetical protein